MAWDPKQYERFAAERAQPFWELIDLVETPAPRAGVVDLGCGSGELSAELARRWGLTSIDGVDNSPSMLARGRELGLDRADPPVLLSEGDIGRWDGTPADGGTRRPYDVIVANASLQWVPDHAGVLARWWSALADDGQLAVQVPANGDHPSHLMAVETAMTEPFRSAMGGSPPPDVVTRNVLAPEQYAILLHHLGARHQHVRLQVFGHVLDSSADVVEWVKGTSLTRFFSVLPDESHEPFVDAYRARLLAVIGESSAYLYPFKRILMWGRR